MYKASAVPDTGFMRIGQVLSVIPIGRSTWWQWVRDGKAPSPIKLGPKTTAWRAEDVRALIQSRGISEG